MNKEEFSRRVNTRVTKRHVAGVCIEQEFALMRRTCINSFLFRKSDSPDEIEYEKMRGESDIADILFGDIVNSLKALKHKYYANPYGFSRDLISDIDDIIESIPQ